MSLPPSTLRVKRKRGEAPVEALQIEHYNDDEHYPEDRHHNKKKPRNTNSGTEAWIFQRVSEGDAKKIEIKQSVSAQQNSWEAKIPVVKATQPGDELRGRATISKEKAEAKSPLNHNTTSSITPAHSAISSSQNEGHDTSTPRRRFHLTRATKTVHRTLDQTNGVRKSRPVATFMERYPNTSRAIRKSFHMKQTEKSAGHQILAKILSATQNPIAIPERALKKPGRNASKSLKPASLAAIGGANYCSEELAAQMQQFSLATMAQDTAERSLEPVSSGPGYTVLRRKSEPKFKPNPPAQRYSERHATEVVSKRVSDTGIKKEDEQTDTEDESDYVTDTYIRVPAHTLQVVPTDLGILVIGNDEEMNEFYEYGEDSEDDSDIFDDEIDENAENNPNNEYPDEEVDSDDELNINAYKYRNHGSDDEEFDFDETSYSDNGNDLPWKKSSWGKHKKPTWEVDDDISDS